MTDLSEEYLFEKLAGKLLPVELVIPTDNNKLGYLLLPLGREETFEEWKRRKLNG
jgi:hypothetical protein